MRLVAGVMDLFLVGKKESVIGPPVHGGGRGTRMILISRVAEFDQVEQKAKVWLSLGFS